MVGVMGLQLWSAEQARENTEVDREKKNVKSPQEIIADSTY